MGGHSESYFSYRVRSDILVVTCSAQNVILTPNQMEFTRLWNAVTNEEKKPSELVYSYKLVIISRLPMKLRALHHPYQRSLEE